MNDHNHRYSIFENPWQQPHHNRTSILNGSDANWNVSAKHKLNTNEDDALCLLFALEYGLSSLI